MQYPHEMGVHSLLKCFWTCKQIPYLVNHSVVSPYLMQYPEDEEGTWNTVCAWAIQPMNDLGGQILTSLTLTSSISTWSILSSLRLFFYQCTNIPNWRTADHMCVMISYIDIWNANISLHPRPTSVETGHMTSCDICVALTVNERVKVGNTIGRHVVEVIKLGLRGSADITWLPSSLES